MSSNEVKASPMLMLAFTMSMGTFVLFIVMFAVRAPVGVILSTLLLLALISAALFWRSTAEFPVFMRALPAMAVVLAVMLGALYFGGVSPESLIVPVISFPLAVLTLCVFLVGAAMIMMGHKGETVAVASLLGTPVYFLCGYTLYLMWSLSPVF